MRPVSPTPDDLLRDRYSELYDTNYRRILRAAYHRVDDLDEAEDVTAEVFISAWRHRDEADVAFNLKWLYSALRNHIGSEYRRRSRVARKIERAGVEMDAAPDHFGATDRSITVRAAITQLDPLDRELIWMAYWDELTGDEMASVLGLNAASLRVRLTRARRRLARILAHLTHDSTSTTPAEEGER